MTDTAPSLKIGLLLVSYEINNYNKIFIWTNALHTLSLLHTHTVHKIYYNILIYGSLYAHMFGSRLTTTYIQTESIIDYKKADLEPVA